jgi:hypothetical protein
MDQFQCVFKKRILELETRLEQIQPPRVQEMLYDLLALNRYLLDLVNDDVENLNMYYRHHYPNSEL